MPSKLAQKKAQSQRRRYLPIGSAVAVAVILTVLAIAFSARESKEARTIRGLMDTARNAALAKDVDTVLGLMDESYTDNLGNDYQRARNRAEQLRRDLDDVSDLHIKFRRMEIEVDKGRNLARTKCELHVSGKFDDGSGTKVPFMGIGNDPNPFARQWETVTVLWAKRGDRWLVTRFYVEPIKSGR